MFFSGKKKAAAAGQATTSATSLKESSPEHVDPLTVEVKRSAKDLRQQPMLPSPLSQSTKDLTFIEPPEKADKQQTSSAFSAEGSPQRRSFFGKKLSLSNSNRNSGEVPSSFFETFLGMVKVSSPLSGSGVVGPEDDVDAQGESPLSKSKASESYMVNTSLSSLDTSIAGTPNGPTSPLAGYSNTIRRRKDKSKTSLATRASITSSALDHDNSSLFTSTLDQDNSREDESLDADDDSVFGISDQLKEIHLFVKSSRESSPYSCLPKAMISEVIRDLIKGVLVLETPDLPEEEKNPDNWRLCKIDRNMLATRIWLQNDASFDSYKINDGDELRLKLVTEKDAIKILPPQASVAITEAFSFEENVKDFTDRLLSKLGIKAGNQKYGLYYKKIGIWLDEKRTVNSYEIDPDHVIDLRIVTQEFLLRVNLPDAETKLTIKVLPSLTVFDVLGMLVYNLSVKRIALDGFRRGGEDVYTPPTSRTKPRISEFQVSSGRKLTKFGLYLPSKNIWLNESKVLEDYNLAKQPDEIHFKPQYHPITISLPQNMASRRSDLLRVHGSDGRISAQNSNLVQVFVSSTNKVKDITDLLNMDNPDFKDSPIAKEFSYGLFTRGNEKLRDEEVLWNLLKDISPLEIIDYRMLTRKITLTSSADLAVKVDVDVDFSKPVESFIPIFCRRFGVLRETEFKQVHLLGSNVPLDLSKSLLQLKISPESTLVFMVEYGQTPLAQKDDDANVWSEVDDSTSSIQYAAEGDKVVTAASLNKLIELLTSAEDGLESSAYLDFMKTFLLTYQSFTTPSAFLKKIIERYHVPRQMYKGLTFQEFEKMRTKVQLRCCNVLQQWTKKHFYDFVDFSGTLSSTQVNVNGNKSQLDQDRKKEQALNKHLLLIKVLDFAEKVIIEDHPLLGKQIRKNVLRLRDGSYISQAQMVRQSSVNSPTPKSPSKPITVGEDINLFALEPEELARQLTVMEFDLFAKLMPYEFLNQAWTKGDADVKAPNIINITKRFNEIASWVAKSILEVKSIKSRVKRLTKLIDVAGYLYMQNNFATLMAFIAGFNKAPVNRLKFTFKELSAKSQKKFSELEKLMSAESSYKQYRGKIHRVNPPCIPYIGVYLLDLTYMEDGNPNRIGDLINFSKRRLINNLIREVQQYQDQPYVGLRSSEEILLSLSKAFTMPIAAPDAIVGEGPTGKQQLFPSVKAYEDFLFQLSLEREPRNSERSQLH